LTAFVVASLGTNPTDFLFLVVPALIWAAVLTPVGDLQRAPVGVTRRWNVLLGAALIPVWTSVILTAAGSATYQLAHDRVARGSSDDALAALDAAIAVDPSQSFYWRERGAFYLADDQSGAAIRDFERALQLLPFDPVTMRGLALAEMASGDLRTALLRAQTVAERHPHDVKTLLVLSLVARAAGQQEESGTALSRALLESPDFAFSPWTDTALAGIDRELALREASQAPPDLAQGETIGPVLLVLFAGLGDPDAAAERAVPGVAHSARALAAVASCKVDLATRELFFAGSSERETSAYWVASAVISHVFPAASAPPRSLSALYLGLDKGMGPATDSLLSADISDEVRFRRAPIETTASSLSVPGSFRGLWLLANDPGAALFPISGQPTACAR
jgi:hypothetical protein